MDYVTGQFGEQFLHDYVKILTSFSGQNIHSTARRFFILALEAMGEVWRRFVLAVSRTPYTLFRLIDMSHPDFLQECAALEERSARCHECIDLEFSTPMLKFLRARGNDQEAVAQVQNLLRSIAVHGPISSDLVECLHGYCQRILSKGGAGARPSDEGAQQRVLWSLITKAFAKEEEFIHQHFGDAYRDSRLAQYGHKGVNQYSRLNKGDGEAEAECEKSVKVRKTTLSLGKMDRLLAFGQGASDLPNPRKLCGALPGIGIGIWTHSHSLSLIVIV